MRPVLRWAAGVAVVVVGVSVGAVALAGGDPTSRYRLATAETGDVAQTVSTNGSVDFVNRADVSFGTAGTLASLAVHAGQQVEAGQRLGALDTAALRAAVDSAEAELANAKATLESDQQRQADAVAPDSGGTHPSGYEPSGNRPAGDKSGDARARLARQQAAVRAAQTAASKALAEAKAALSAQRKACATPPPSSDTPAAADKAAPTEEPAQDTACANALARAAAAQDAVGRAQDTLQRAIAALTATLSAASAQADTPASPSSPSSPTKGSSPANPSSPEGEQGAPTAATIASDQAAVDAADVDLASANRSLAQATLTAPIAGTVASIEAAAGDTVSAGSAVVVLIGDGAAVVETTVPVERIDEIEVGQRATVTPTGAQRGVAGRVSRIGRLAESSSGSGGSGGSDDSVTYPVTVTVDDPAGALQAGSVAGVDIVVDTAEHVLTVPTSAVHGQNPATVTVLDGTQSTQQQVTVGAVGPLRTEITGGLSAGDRVVLADLDEPLPDTDNQNGGLGGLKGGGPVMKGGPPVRIGR
jgi:HlyD family secretion protein